MPGRHEAPGLGPFYRQLLGFLVLLGAAGVLVVGGAMSLEGRLSSAPVPETTTTQTTTTEPTTTEPARAHEPATGTTGTTRSIQTTTIAVRPPAEIEVLVLNGTGRNQLAAEVTELLAEEGYRTLEPANADRSYSTSRIRYGPGFGAEALELAEHFPDGIVEEHPDADPPADLIVIIGASYRG